MFTKTLSDARSLGNTLLQMRVRDFILLLGTWVMNTVVFVITAYLVFSAPV